MKPYILILVLTASTVMSILYAYTQRMEAERQFMRAEDERHFAEQMRKEAAEVSEETYNQIKDLNKRLDEATGELEKCKAVALTLKLQADKYNKLAMVSEVFAKTTERRAIEYQRLIEKQLREAKEELAKCKGADHN